MKLREFIERFEALGDEAFLAKAGLRRVLFCDELREDRRPIPSLPNYNRTLILSLDDDRDYLARLFHHELFHFIDLADDGSVLRDPEWEKLNAPGFTYGLGGRMMRGPEASAEPPPRGFVSGYGTASLEEDKAEIFAELIWAPQRFAARSRHDSIVAAIIRPDDVLIPDGESTLAPGDQVVVFALPTALQAVEQFFQVK